MLKFIVENQAAIIALTAAIISEVMALNPKWKYNGILQLTVNILKRVRR